MPRVERGENMATATLTLSSWRAEYYETMAAAERAQQRTLEVKPGLVGHLAGLVLFWPFRQVNNETEKLLSLLGKLESYPSAVLFAADGAKIPEALRELFKTMCDVIQGTESLSLHRTLFLKRQVVRLRALSQMINGYAVRFEDVQRKLSDRVPAERVANYQASFAAYADCRPKPSQGASDEDLDSEPFHPTM
jgi:hypothetical protein